MIIMSDTTLSKVEFDAEADFGDFFALLKPRVMILVVFTALVGIIAALQYMFIHSQYSFQLSLLPWVEVPLVR